MNNIQLMLFSFLLFLIGFTAHAWLMLAGLALFGVSILWLVVDVYLSVTRDE